MHNILHGITALAGGRIDTETRLRMVYYLLDQKGLQSGTCWSYSIRHCGPYSPHFEPCLLKAILFDSIQETIERRPSDGAPYTALTTNEPYTPVTLGALSSERAKALILQIAPRFALLLELAASAHWFIVHEQDPNWQTTLKRRKGALAENGRLEEAVSILHTLELLPAGTGSAARIL